MILADYRVKYGSQFFEEEKIISQNNMMAIIWATSYLKLHFRSYNNIETI